MTLEELARAYAEAKREADTLSAREGTLREQLAHVAQLEVVRETGVGRAFGVESGLLSRGGRTAKLTLGGGRVVVIETEED